MAEELDAVLDGDPQAPERQEQARSTRHDQIGIALGVVLNRPSDTPVLDPFPGWDDVATSPPVLFVVHIKICA
jgi:hypothetical protein